MPFWIYAGPQIAYIELNFIKCGMFSSLAFNASYKGSLTRIYYSKLYSLAHLILMNVFFSLKRCKCFVLISYISHSKELVLVFHSTWQIGTNTSRISYQCLTITVVRNTYEVKFHIAYIRIFHIDKIPNKSVILVLQMQII